MDTRIVSAQEIEQLLESGVLKTVPVANTSHTAH